MTPSAVHIRLLGGFDLIYRDAPVVGVNTARLQSLLAYLILHTGSPQLRQYVAFLLWPDSPESHARNNLRQFLHQLRQALPEPERFLAIDAQTICWKQDEGQFIDVQLFLSRLTEAEAALRRADSNAARHWLEQALSYYRGDLLPGCYDEWITPEREQLRQQCQTAYQKLANVLEERREYATAVHAAQHMLRLDPLNENTYILLMRLHALDHDRQGVRRTYQGAVKTLRRELDVEPGAALQQAYQRYQRLPETPSLSAERDAPTGTSLMLVGRQPEWQLLQAVWRRVANGDAHFVLVTGEAGIGKSRLAEELFTWAKRQGFNATHTRSYAAEGRLSFAPVTEWLRSAALRPHLNALDNVWLTEIARLLPELLSEHVDLDHPEPISEYGQRQRFFEALARAILAAPQPMLLWIDDLQWCDSETLEWLHFLLRFRPHYPLLVLGTARSEESPPDHPVVGLARQLRAESKLTSIELSPFDTAETARLASQIQGHELTVVASVHLYRETEGNPLFVVETVRASTGSTFVAGSGETAVTEQEWPVLPPRVYAVIAGRLAQLAPSARKVAELGAAIGRAFTLDMLLHAGHDDEATTVHALDELWQKRIVREQSANVFDFTHDKLREVAYAEISAPQRRLLHRHIAQALEVVNADSLDPVSAQIAAHYEQAGLFEQALPYYQRAGAVAKRIYANEEAISLLNKGLLLLHRLPPGPERDTRELALQTELGVSLVAARGYGASEVIEVYSRAQSLCHQLGKPSSPPLLRGLAIAHIARAEFQQGSDLGTQILRQAERDEDSVLAVEAHFVLGATLFWQGQFRQARTHLDQALARYDPQHIHTHLALYAQDPKVVCLCRLALDLWFLGYPDQASRIGQESLVLARALAHPFSLTYVMYYDALRYAAARQSGEVLERAKATIASCREYHVDYWYRFATILLGWARGAHGDVEAGIAQICEGLDMVEAASTVLMRPHYLTLLAELYAKAGDVERGLELLVEALAAAGAHGEHWCEAEIYRVRGELLLASGAGTSAVEALFQRAIEIAQAQQARSLELRAATSLARLWDATGRSEAARQLLTPLYSWFTEGFDTPDLQAARSLIAQL